MKKYTPIQLIRMLGVPAVTVLIGLILLFSPDTASALVGKLLAWCCILSALALGAGALLGPAANRNNRLLWTAICFAAGFWMLLNPLTVAKFLGRVLGTVLMLRGGQTAAENIRYKGGKLVITRALVIAAVVAVVGAVLLILPLATSRMVFSVIGIVMICVGAAEGIDRLKGPKLLDEGDDPNIIDVEKV